MSSSVVNRFDDRHLSGESSVADSPDDLLAGRDYDYVLTGMSWDERSVALSRASVTANVVQVLRPSNVGVSGRREAHDSAIHAWAERIGQSTLYVDGASEEVEEAFRVVQDCVVTLRKELDRPLRILVDLSAAVRYVTLGLVALALNEGMASAVDVFYAEALYVGGEASRSTDDDAMAGGWEAVAVPGLEGDWYPSRARHFFVSVGFHGERAARLAERWDPNRVSVLVPQPALTEEYARRTAEANAAWMQRFKVTEADSVAAPPTDAITTWRELGSASVLAPEHENIYCLLCGSKPHALALTLWALARQTPAVLYVRPDQHSEQSVDLTGKFWLYRLWDRTLLSHSETGDA